MKTPTLKITGPVFEVNKKDGISKAGKAWQMTEVTLRFVDEYNGTENVNLMKFTFFGKAADYAAAAKPGDVVEIEFEIKGKIETKNNNKYYNENLNGRTFKFPETAKPETTKPAPKISTPSALDGLEYKEDDDLPF